MGPLLRQNDNSICEKTMGAVRLDLAPIFMLKTERNVHG